MNKTILLLVITVFAGCTTIENEVFPTEKDFMKPPLSYHPAPLWFWNNTRVSGSTIDIQMQKLRDSCGYGGFGILPFGMEFKPEYLSEEYFEVYEKALDKASELGLKLCLYDEFGFPSGGIGSHNGDGKGRFELRYPDQTMKRLDKKEIDIKGPAVVSEKLPEGKLMAAVAIEENTFGRLDLRNMVVEGMLDWKAPSGQWKVMLFTCVKDGDPLVDYLDPKAVRNFIKMVHDAYYSRFEKYFGNVIDGTFFDEPTLYRAQGRVWTDDFNEKFAEKYGFSPDTLYPALWYDIGPDTRSARNLLFGFRSELYAKGYTKEVNDWSVAHGIKATGHQDQEEVLNPVSVSGDLMKCFKYLEIPGIDKIGGNRPAERFYKLISSAAYNWDKTRVMSETYGAMGDISWNEMFSIAIDQYAKGINILIPHAVWYNDNNVTFKPELSYRNPIYADSLRVYNRFLARLNLLLQNDGRHVADIAILYPIHTLQGEHYLDGPLGFYQGGVDIPKTDYIDVANWLTEEAGKDFTFLHPEVLDEKCSVSMKNIHLAGSFNPEVFSVLVFPSCKTVSVTNLKKAMEFYNKGGNLIFTTQLPEYSAEPGKDGEIENIMNLIKGNAEWPEDEILMSRGGGKAVFISEPDGSKIRDALHKFDVVFDVKYPVYKDLRYIHKVLGGRHIFYFANIGGSYLETEIQFKDKYDIVRWDPHTGNVEKLKCVTIENESGYQTRMSLTLQPYNSLFWIGEKKK